MSDWIDNGYLYHYTNAHALLSIVEKRKIWATHNRFLNDGRDSLVISDILSEMADHPDIYFGESAQIKHPQKFREALRQHLSHGRVQHVASFTKVPNMLTQFRMYCPPSGGFVIGFPRAYLEKAGTLVEVTYDRTAHVAWCSEFFDMYMEAAKKMDDEQPTLSAVELSNRLEDSAGWSHTRTNFSPAFKNAEFVFEQEVRLVKTALSSRVRASANGSLLIPYVEIDLPNESVEVHIASGPSRYGNLSRRSEGSLQLAARAAGTKWNLCQLGIGEFGYRDLACF